MFFRASGAYFWRHSLQGDLVGEAADTDLDSNAEVAEKFRGLHRRLGDDSLAAEAMQRRRPFFVGQLEVSRDQWMTPGYVHSALAGPVFVSGEAYGAIVYLRSSPESKFDDDGVTRLALLCAQLAKALEGIRPDRFLEGPGRDIIPAEAAALPDIDSVMESLADRLRVLLHSPTVLVFVQREKAMHLRAVAAQSPKLVQAIRARSQQNELRSPMEIATRAMTAGERISVGIDGASHFGQDSPPGILIATPFRTARARGAVLVYPRLANPFTPDEKALASTLAGFGAVAVANAELHEEARAQVQQLQNTLEASAAIGSARDPNEIPRIAAIGAATPDAEDPKWLGTTAAEPSVRTESPAVFKRMPQANSHWLEVFDAIGDFIVVHDEHNNILRVNRSLADFVGIAPEQLVGINMRALEALSPSAPPHACAFCGGGGAEGDGEYAHPALDRTYLISTSRVQAAGTGQMQTVHVLKDITDRREAERRYRELFDNIQEGIYVSTPQGRFVEVNDALVRILGYGSRNEVLQLDIPSQVYFAPQRRKDLSEQLKNAGEVRNHQEVLRRKDGSPVHVFMNCVAVRDAAGNVMQHRGLMLDVSGLHESQADLQKERDFSGKILNHTQSLILVTDGDGVIRYANRRWSGLGFQQSQVLGHSLTDLVAAPRRAAMRDALAAVAHGQQVDNLDMPLLRGDGVSSQFSVNLSPIGDEYGGVASIVVVMTDVTDSAMLRTKLVHAEKMAAVGQLVSGVAHEVNNPLTAILGFTDLLMESPDIPESARRKLQVILQEAQRTKLIVQNLLSFARQMPPQRHPVQLNNILERTVHLRSYDFISHGIQVLEFLDEALPEVVGDSHQLQQVFLNILNNAYDAVRETARSARIEIRSARLGAFVEVSFRDNGMGIADAERIFDPFFTTKDIGKGTGLGLSICYGIVREHGGEIVCCNNPDSEGATFTVRLPIALGTASFGAAAGVNPP